MHVVYRCLDVVGDTVYVGITKNLEARCRQHRHVAAWWDEVDHVETIATFESRDEAHAIEAYTIGLLRPRFNFNHNPDGRARPGRKRGRPAGLILNPDAFEVFRRGTPAVHVARKAGISPGHMSSLRAGSGASQSTAERLAAALSVTPGALFPELSGFVVEAA